MVILKKTQFLVGGRIFTERFTLIVRLETYQSLILGHPCLLISRISQWNLEFFKSSNLIDFGKQACCCELHWRWANQQDAFSLTEYCLVVRPCWNLSIHYYPLIRLPLFPLLRLFRWTILLLGMCNGTLSFPIIFEAPMALIKREKLSYILLHVGLNEISLSLELTWSYISPLIFS